MAIVVRQATTADLDALVPLFGAYRVFYRKTSDPELARTFLSERLSRNQSVVFLAMREDGAAVGFTQLYPSFSSAAAAPVFILNDLFVAPDARRNGVGALLLAAAVRFACAAGAVWLTLSTEVTNRTAQALYEKEGWVRQSDFFVYNLGLV